MIVAHRTALSHALINASARQYRQTGDARWFEIKRHKREWPAWLHLTGLIRSAQLLTSLTDGYLSICVKAGRHQLRC